MSWNPKYALLIALSTAITFFASKFIYRFKGNKRAQKICLIFSLVSNLGILAVFKYANFFISNLNTLLSAIGLTCIDKGFDFLLPVGISFYTFQVLSYSLDVYYEKLEPENNFLKYALFVSFFPQLVAGPIERSTNLLPQIQNVENINVWNLEAIKQGFFLMIWGLFQKLVIADRISLLVNNVINNYTNYGFLEIATAVVLFAFQIYCDFGGYSNIAKGAARVMGFTLMDNFREPYLATSIKGFWRRWHISLTSWFTDYIYIPLGGNRLGLYRKYLNILIVFAVSGLWHGASWNFVAWGLLHAAYQIVGDFKNKLLKTDLTKTSIITRIRKTLINFVLVDFAWIFFVASSLRAALGIIKQMFTHFHLKPLLELGLDKNNWIILIIAFIILALVDILKEKRISIFGWIDRRNLLVRVLIYSLSIWSVIMLGIYGVNYDTSTFIYFQF